MALFDPALQPIEIISLFRLALKRTRMYSGYATTSGSAAMNDTLVYESDSTNVYDTPRVTSTGTALGAGVRHDGLSYGAFFVTLDDAGAVLKQATGNSTFGRQTGDVTTSGANFVVANYRKAFASGTSTDTFNFASVNSDASVGESVARDPFDYVAEHMNVAQQGNTSGAIFTNTGDPSVHLMRFVEGTMLGPIELAAPGQRGDIIALSTGDFALAWATPDGFAFEVRSTNGTTVECSIPKTQFGNGQLDVFDSVALAETSQGIVVVVTDTGDKGEAGLFLIGTDCTPLSEEGDALFNNSISPFSGDLPYQPRIAVGGGSIAVAWTALDGDEYSSYVRVMPENLCE